MNIVRYKLFLIVAFAAALISGSQASAQVWRQISPAVGYNVGINPLNPNTIYCERTLGSLWVSRDRGGTWTNLGSTNTSSIRHILVHPKDTLTIFVVAFSGGLWKTTNEGANWTQVLATSFGGNNNSYGIDGESMDYDANHPDTIFAGNFGDGAVYRSLDRGTTWSFRGLSGNGWLCALAVRPDSSNILFAGTGTSTISKSTDYGATWAIKNSGGTEEVPKIVIDPNHPLVAYATTNSNGIAAEDPACNVWKTTNGGETWFKTGLQNIANWSMAMDVQHPESLWVGLFGALSTSTGMRHTTDGGATFKQFDRGLPPKFASWNLRIHPLDPSFVVTAGTAAGFFDGGGIFKFLDTSATRVEGTVRDAGTNNPLVANLQLVEVADSIRGSSTFEFGYYPGDPTLTPTVHVSAPGYYSKDTTLFFTLNSVNSQDIHLTPLPANSVSGYVFEDLNGNGLKDPGESGLSNWLVRMSGPVNDSIFTDVNGAYLFDSLVNGTYTLSEDVQPAWIESYPVCPGTQIVTFTTGTSQTDINFGNQQDVPGVTLFSEDFTTPTFPPPCWAVQNVNGGFTWLRATTNVFSGPAAARNGTGNNPDGAANDWLFTRPVQLEPGRTYRLSWYDRTFINGVPSGLDSLDIAIGANQNAASMTQIINSRAFNTNLAFEQVQQNFTVPSGGTYYIGFHDYSATGNTIRVDDVKLVYLAASSSSISGMKFSDTNNNGVKDTLEPGLPGWKILLTGDATDSAITDANGNYFFGVNAGNYTVSEVNQAGWTQTFPLSGTYSISIGSGQNLTGRNFGNFHPNSLKVRKFRDADGNFNTAGDRAMRTWHLEIRQGSENGPVVASADADSVSATGLADGTYYAFESDSAGWTHIGYDLDAVVTSGNDTAVAVTLSGGQARKVDFTNFHPNSITVRKFQDGDANFGTAGDRTAKHWHLEVRAGSVNGTAIASGDTGTVSAANLGDGSYYAVEADSAGWIRMGYVLNGSPIPGADSAAAAVLTDGTHATIDFVNAPPVYGQTFRSFHPDSIALDKDNKGKIGKYVKRKAVRSDFEFTITPSDSATDLHVEFDQAIDQVFPFTVSPAASATNSDGKGKKWDYHFSSLVHNSTLVTIAGYGSKGKPIKVGKYYWSFNGTIVGGKLKNPPFTRNVPKLPMPNRINALFETFEQGGFGSNGLLVGIDKSTPVDSSKQYGWLLSPKYTDVLKTLSDKTGLQHGSPAGFDNYTSNGKPILKRQKSLPPSKKNNILLAHMIALKLNIAASALGKTPPGFGELIFTGPFQSCGLNLNGMMVKDIAAVADTVMMGSYPGPHFFDGCKIAELDSVIELINSSFEGAVDTIDFAAKLHLKGTKQLIDVPYLRYDANIKPTIIAGSVNPVAQTPRAFALYQNYPNPFNPTTTISFDLPEESFVTLKVYNVLGQEVATLLEHEQFDEGSQDVEFDAGRLSSGMYFYRIYAQPLAEEDGSASPAFVKVGKMLLVK